jgi:hypothetical protein
LLRTTKIRQQLSDQTRKLTVEPPNNVVPVWAQQILNGQAMMQQQVGGLTTQQQLGDLQQQVGACSNKWGACNSIS